MNKEKTLVPWFQRGDIGGMTYSITNNIVNYLIVITTLSGVLEWPDEIVYGSVIPGMSVGLMLSGIYYAFMGRRLSKKEGRTTVDFSGIGFYIPNPVNSVQHLINGFSVVLPYLTIVIPVEIYNFIETMDNVEGANAAGDNYDVRETQFADGICTMLSAVCGGVIPNTVWLGHAGLKKSHAGIGYSLVSGLVLGAAGIFGLFTFLSNMVPPAVCAVTFLWCAVVMVAQAFKDCPVKHYGAIAVAMVPPVADYLYTQITGAVGLAGYSTEVLADGTSGYNAEVTQMIKDAGVMWNGVPGVKAGAIIIGILLGTMTVFIIEKQLHKVGITALVGFLLACFGFIHSAQLGFYPTSPFAIGYLIIAVLAFLLHLGRNTWFKGPDDFEYV